MTVSPTPILEEDEKKEEISEDKKEDQTEDSKPDENKQE